MVMLSKMPFILCGTSILFSSLVFSAEIKRTEKIEKIFRFQDPEAENQLVVDNFYGSIRITGYQGQEVRLTVLKTVAGRTEEKIEEAEEEIYLDITEEEDYIELYVDGPFRCENGLGIHWKGWKREGYKVVYDFEIRVPRDVAFELKTVMEGEIEVSSMRGNFEVHNVNGGIVMEEIGGSGEAYAVNGEVKLDFDKNPKNKCRFGALNGEVYLHFQPGLSADFYLKTFNGEFYTDFRVKAMAPEMFQTEDKNGKRVYKAGHLCRVRAGNGGPKIKLDGFNRDMYILQK
jgi:hypothetical protein